MCMSDQIKSNPYLHRDLEPHLGVVCLMVQYFITELNVIEAWSMFVRFEDRYPSLVLLA
jgi:hypothetical protein